MTVGDDGVMSRDDAREARTEVRAHARVGHRGAEVELLGDEPAPRLERPDEPPQRGSAVGQPRQQQARVDDIELALGQVVLERVMDPHLEVRVR